MFCFPQGGGIKEYIVNLTNLLTKIDPEDEYVFYVLEDQYEYATKMLPTRGKVKTIPYQNKLVSKIKRSLFSQLFWSKEEKVERFDIFHSPFYYAPKMKRAKLVVTIHDLRLYRYPETYGFLRYHFLKRAVKDTLKRADQIISISQFTKNEAVETCGVTPDKIEVIHEAIDRFGFSAKHIEGYSIPREYMYLENNRFLFSLSHIEPRKNYIRLIKAFSEIKKNNRFNDLKLVIAGRKNLKAESVIKLIEDTKDVIYLDYVPREFLLWLYRSATLFIFPSYYEGFGFPPLEAASMGTVSAVSKASSIPEVCGESAFYFDPYDEKDMSEIIKKALDNEQQIGEKKMKLEQQLSKFSWEENARKTLNLYKRSANVVTLTGGGNSVIFKKQIQIAA